MNRNISLIVGGVVIVLAILSALCCGIVFLFGAAAPDPEIISVTRRPTIAMVEVATFTLEPATPAPIPTRPPTATLPLTVTSIEAPPGIPGLEHGSLRLNLKDIGFECKPIDSIQSGGQQTVTVSGCQKQEDGYLMGIDTASRDPNDLDQIKAYVVFTGEPDPAVAEAFLGMIAGLPYEGADPDAATAWVKENLAAIQGDTDVKTAWFGPVHFELSGNEQGKNLRVGSYLGVTSGEQ